MKSKTVYTTIDGEEFTDLKAAEAHETKLSANNQEKYQKYVDKLITNKHFKHKLTDVGIWQVTGESDDMGGYWDQEDFGLYEGKLDDVVRKVAGLPGFFTWGNGGTIQKVKITKV